jgi:hypothetical protein
MEAHRLNGTWEFVKLPPGKHAIRSRWFIKVKHNADGSLDRYKVRLVAKGYSQQPGFDFKETFAPTVRYSTIGQASCSLTTMSSANSFAALSAPSLAPPFGESSSLVGSKHPYSALSSPLMAPSPCPVDQSSLEAIDRYSVFNILNIFHHCWFISCNHLIANVLSAT